MAHDFPKESLVCYIFVEQMAAGIVAILESVATSCGILTGKVSPCGAALAEEKGWQAVRICTVCDGVKFFQNLPFDNSFV